jgi:hypothetical protein
MPPLHSAISAATLCSAFSITTDVVLYSGTVGDGRCARTHDSYYYADHECYQAKSFTCVKMEKVHPELTPEVFDATNCSSTPSSCSMDTTNIDKDHLEFKPFHSHRLSSNGKILRARIPSPPVDPTTLAWSVEGVNYVIRSVIHGNKSERFFLFGNEEVASRCCTIEFDT